MNRLLILFCALALGQMVIAFHEPTTTVSKGLIRSIISVITGGFRPSPHIVGGHEVEPHSHPHQAALYTVLEGGEKSFCGGSVIATQWVLTAAHCLEKANDTMATLGAHFFWSVESDTQTMMVEKVIRHEYWNATTYDGDIALLKLAAEVKLSSADFSPFLRSAESYVTSATFCNLYYGEISDDMLCVDTLRGGGVCGGDSGGPLTVLEADGQRTLIGVTSFGFQAGCELGYPTVFTRVDSYLEWIRNNTGIQLREE